MNFPYIFWLCVLLDVELCGFLGWFACTSFITRVAQRNNFPLALLLFRRSCLLLVVDEMRQHELFLAPVHVVLLVAPMDDEEAVVHLGDAARLLVRLRDLDQHVLLVLVLLEPLGQVRDEQVDDLVACLARDAVEGVVQEDVVAHLELVQLGRVEPVAGQLKDYGLLQVDLVHPARVEGPLQPGLLDVELVADVN